MPLKFTARNVLTLKPGPGGTRATYRDTVERGLELRVSASGRRVYRVRYGADGSKAVTIGDARVLALTKARKRARNVLGQVADGADPAAEKAKARRVRAVGADTFQGLAERLVDEADLATSTRRSWTWTLEKRLYPLLGDRAPREVSRPEVRDTLAQIAERHGALQANEALKVIRWVFARAVDAEIVEASPAAGIRKLAKERPRDRVLKAAELRAVWNAAGEAGVYGQGVRFAILSGARRGEVFEAQWSEIDREAKIWRLPAARTKNRRPHEIPLTATLLELLDELPEAEEGERLFSAAPTSKGWARLLRAGGLIPEAKDDDEERTRADRWPVRFHDLRRTFRNALTAELGVAPHVAEALIGHAESGLVRTYAPAGVPLADRRRALEKWARYLRAVVSAKVLEFPEKRKRSQKGS